MAKDKGGRPTVMTPEVIQKLEAAFSRDATDLEACYHAGISKSAFYEHQDASPGFKERKDLLKAGVTLAVRNTVIDGIVGVPARLNAAGKVLRKELPPNPELGLKWMERKLKKEFGLRSEHVVVPKDELDDLTDEELDAQRRELERKVKDGNRRASDKGRKPKA